MDFNDTDLVLDDLWASAHFMRNERKLIVCCDPDCPPGLLNSVYNKAEELGIHWIVDQYYDATLCRDVYVFGGEDAEAESLEREPAV